MRYIVHIRIDEKKKLFPIDAKDKDEALERLKLRLPPHQRDTFILDTINIDPKSMIDDEPYGIFGEE